MKERETVITDLNDDDLSCIFISLAQSGVQHLARVILGCKWFSAIGKRGDVLRAVKFNGIQVSVDDLGRYQQINGLIRLAAEAGNSAAQSFFAQIIMMSCTKLIGPEFDMISYKRDLIPVTIFYQPLVDKKQIILEKQQSQAFLSNLDAKSSCTGKGLFHYQFVKTFLTNCSPKEFKVMCYDVRCYKAYYKMDSDDSVHSLEEMVKACSKLESYRLSESDWEWIKSFCSAPSDAAMEDFVRLCFDLLRALVEECRSQALLDLDAIFMAAE